MASRSQSPERKRKVAVNFLGIDPFLKTPDEDPAWLAAQVSKLAPQMRITSRQLARVGEILTITYGVSADCTTPKGISVAFNGWLIITENAEDGSFGTGGKKSWKKQRREQITGRA